MIKQIKILFQSIYFISYKNILKNIIFNIHWLGMYIVPFLWILNSNMVYFYLIVILSWKLNENKCLLTQIEYYYFNETFLGKGKKFYVPRKHRYIMYFNFLINILIKLL